MESAPFLEFRSPKARSVSVAGDFNDWAGSTKGRFDPHSCRMTRKSDGRWVFPLTGVTQGNHQFKFIIDEQWEGGANRSFFLDDKGRLLDPTGGITSVVLEDAHRIRVRFSGLAVLPARVDVSWFSLLPQGTILSLDRHEGQGGDGDIIDLNCRGFDLHENLRLQVKGLGSKLVVRPVLPDGIFQRAFISTKPLGATVEGNPPTTVFRLFAPRASHVTLEVFADPQMKTPLRTVPAGKDPDGVWEMRLEGLWWGKYYGFQVEGPGGEGEGFDARKVWPDPYARAAVHHNGPAILLDPTATGQGFSGWSDGSYRTPRREDLVIWECSIRDLTTHASAHVPPAYQGKYLGLATSPGTGSGIDHVKRLGANAVEFLPVFEFDDDPPGTYHWGYMPSLFFAPEASYATEPHGAQVNECKALVDTLHRHGIAVILDVVYNHTGAPQVLMGMDKKYYFRHDGNLTLHNFSGCGNDFKTENPMARRIILDSLEHWVREYHIDGFRFDLAELLNFETLQAIEERLVAVKPDIILIAEPWSFRGSNKGQLKGTRWSSWNDDFRNRVKEAAQGKAHADTLFPVLRGSVDLWTGSPIESVNYVESHDDFTLTDTLSHRKDHDGSSPTPLEKKRNLFCAAAVLLSPGIPMIAQGQEMLRSKKGNHNSYNAGDVVNTVDYTLRERHPEVFEFYRGLIALRQSEDGRLFREADASACRALTVLRPTNTSAIGLHWESPSDPKRQMLVLFNAHSTHSAVFQPSLKHGVWVRLVGDGRVYQRTDFSRRELAVSPSDEKGVTIDLPPLAVEVWVPQPKRS